MKSLFSQFALFSVLLTPVASLATDIVLREQASQYGTVIRLSDIADITGGSPQEVNELANIPLLPAPAGGTKQFLTLAQIRDLLTARGVRLNEVHMHGALVVELTKEMSNPSQKQRIVRADFQKPRSAEQLTWSAAEVQAGLDQAIKQFVSQKTNHSRWQVEAIVDERVLKGAQPLNGPLQVEGSEHIRTSGSQRFVVADGYGSKVSVVAKIAKIQTVVVANQQIKKGQLVSARDVEVADRTGNLSRAALKSLEAVVGKEAQRDIRPQQIVQAGHVHEPTQVRRGETVNVFVRTGGISVRTRAIAKQDGSIGDLIVLETLEDKQRLDGSISGPGEVTIYATGGQATDYASLGSNTRR